MPERTPIALITGALGSGKTTLLRHILDAPDRRLAILMNEFGEIAIDSRILTGENLRLIELAGGCVCCELTGEFEAAVNELIERFQPELIIVEATGVAESDALASEVQDNLPQVRLDSVIHVVDAFANMEHPEVGYTARSQLRQADILLINKIDLVDPSAIETVEMQSRKYNDRAFALPAVRCRVDPGILFGLNTTRRQYASAVHSDAHFESFVYTTGRLLDRNRFEQAVTRLPASVYRAKGFVRFEGESLLFNYVAGRMDLEPFAADETQLVFIGPHLAPVKHVILKDLADCEV
jgi:G3E family GTPase